MSENDHKHHVPAESDLPKIQRIREATIEYEKMLDELCPPGRDLSIAKTNLEQARMWGIAALVKPRPPVPTDKHPETGMPIKPPHTNG